MKCTGKVARNNQKEFLSLSMFLMISFYHAIFLIWNNVSKTQSRTVGLNVIDKEG